MKADKLVANILADKEINKAIKNNSYYSAEQFISDANTYIKAIKQGRMLCTIKSVSNSGMSRSLAFYSCEPSKHNHWFRQYWALFSALGYKESRNNRDAFTVNGCGMDMVFHTNYSIIHKLGKLGFISKNQVATLAQKTPTVL